jgi:hypothetical protein
VKYRALRLDSGNFAWGSEHTTQKTRIIGVVCDSLVIFEASSSRILNRCTTLPTMSLSEQILLSRVPLSRLMPLPSVSGMKDTYVFEALPSADSPLSVQ